MAIGLTSTTTPGDLNNQLGNYSLQLRNLMQSLREFTQWFDGLSAADQASQFGIVAGSADNTNLTNCMGYLSTIAGVYNGTATQATAFDFDNALSVLWGGQ